MMFLPVGKVKEEKDKEKKEEGESGKKYWKARNETS